MQKYSTKNKGWEKKMNKKYLIGAIVIVVLGILISFFGDKTVSSLDLVETNCPIGQGYKLENDFDMPIYKGITPKQFYNTSYDIIKNGEWCQLLVEGVPEAVAYECSSDKFEHATTNGYGVEGSYSYACQGIFKSSLITKKYWDEGTAKFVSTSTGKLEYYEPEIYTE